MSASPSRFMVRPSMHTARHRWLRLTHATDLARHGSRGRRRRSSQQLPAQWYATTPTTRRSTFVQLIPHGTGYVEDMSKGKMLRFEDSLPRLPVPSLQETAQRYIKS